MNNLPRLLALMASAVLLFVGIGLNAEKYTLGPGVYRGVLAVQGDYYLINGTAKPLGQIVFVDGVVAVGYRAAVSPLSQLYVYEPRPYTGYVEGLAVFKPCGGHYSLLYGNVTQVGPLVIIRGAAHLYNVTLYYP